MTFGDNPSKKQMDDQYNFSLTQENLKISTSREQDS